MNTLWLGNVRKLTNVIEYAFAVGRGTELNLDQLPPEFRESTAYPLPQTHPAPALIANEAERIAHALQQSNGNLEQAAKLLGISRATLWRKRKKYQRD